MSLFDFLFGKAGETTSTQQDGPEGVVRWDGGTLKYDPDLIPKLTQEHRTLLLLFEAIRHAYEAGNFAAVQKALADFKIALNAHLLVENVRFYAYVKNSLAQDKKKLETMTTFWKDMQAIAKVVMQFLGTYEGCAFTAEMRASFGQDLHGIGVALSKRITHEEESLYTLYRPVHTY